MANKSEDWEELADKLGFSKELMSQMGIENLTPEQIQMLHTVIDLHAHDQQSLNNFIKETGLKSVLNNLPQLEEEEIKNQNKLNSLLEQIKKITAQKDLNVE